MMPHKFKTSPARDVLNHFISTRTWPPRPIPVGRAGPADLEPLPRRPAPPRLGPTGFCVPLRARSIHLIHATEPRIDNPGRALGLSPRISAVLNSPPPARELLTSSHEHSSKPHRFCFCKSFPCNFLRLPNASPQLAKKKPCAFFLTDFTRQRRAAGRRGRSNLPGDPRGTSKTTR